MKHIIFSLFLITNCTLSFCQADNNTEVIRGELNSMSRFGSRQSGTEALQSFASTNVKGSQFYFPLWYSGSLITPSNEEVETGFLYLYDKINQDLYMKTKDSAQIMKVDAEKINGFTIQNNGKHYFVKASTLTQDGTKGFFEVLVKNDSGYSLYKSVTTKFVKFDPSDMVKIKNGYTFDEFDDDISYFVTYKNGSPQPIKLKDNNMKKVLSKESNKVDDYLSINYNNERNEAFLVILINSIN